MHVEAVDGKAHGPRTSDGIERLQRVEAELRAAVPGSNSVVRRGVDTRCDPDERTRDSRGRGALRLVGGVEHDEGSELACEPQLFVGLVVAVNHDAVAAEPRRLRERELAERRDIRTEALLGEQAQQRHVREGLRPVDHRRVAHGAPDEARTLAQRALAVDDERRAELIRERARGQAADHELAGRDRGRFREQC